MVKLEIDAFALLARIRAQKPVVHHLTNWVTIYDCAQVVKVLGGSPVMAHAREEVAEMAGIASALVLNIGTPTPELVAAMKLAAASANRRGIPVVLDACGAGATKLRDRACFELLQETRVDIIKGNASEVARISGEAVRTKGVDAAEVHRDLREVSRKVAESYHCTVAITGREDIVAAGARCFIVQNGHPWLTHVVGTGCMAASTMGAFAAVEADLAVAATSALVCFEVAAETAAQEAGGPGTFKERFFDRLYHLDKQTIDEGQRVVAG